MSFQTGLKKFTECTSYADAHKIWTTSRKRKLGHNTTLVEYGTGYGVELYNTVVVIYHSDGSITCNTGGWNTPLTRSRIDTFTPDCVHSKAFKNKTLIIVGGATWSADAGFQLVFEPGQRIPASKIELGFALKAEHEAYQDAQWKRREKTYAKQERIQERRSQMKLIKGGAK